MLLVRNRSAEIQASLRSLFMGAPIIGILLLTAAYVCMEMRCMCVWNMEWLLCTICPLLGYFSLMPRCLIERVVAPEKPAVWRWERPWMDGHRKGWMESRKLFTQNGGSGTWQSALPCALWRKESFQNVSDCDDSICISIIIRCPLITAVLYL